ncbi:hypothetical protein GGI08_007459 [Coemansia sp. S2]|nr:hypothetical protein GGI08_007459 [Coemansia sp. S2]
MSMMEQRTSAKLTTRQKVPVELETGPCPPDMFEDEQSTSAGPAVELSTPAGLAVNLPASKLRPPTRLDAVNLPASKLRPPTRLAATWRTTTAARELLSWLTTEERIALRRIVESHM